MRNTRVHSLYLAIPMAAVACVGGGGGSGAEGSAGSGAGSSAAVADCERLIDAECASAERCGNPLTDAECRADLAQDGLDCALAVQVSAQLNACIAAVDVRPCDESGPPDACFDADGTPPITLGEAPPPPAGELHSCFDVADGLQTCDDYCQSVGKTCSTTCDIIAGGGTGFGAAGHSWSEGGCPDTDAQRTVLLECDWEIDTQGRCCCA